MGGLARRKPLLLSLLCGLFLLRAAPRTLCGSLFHEPPRSTHGPPFGPFPSKVYRHEDTFAQSQGVGMAGVANPGLHARIDVGPVQPALGVAQRKRAQAPAKAQTVLVAQPAMVRKNVVAQQIDAFSNLANLTPVQVQLES